MTAGKRLVAAIAFLASARAFADDNVQPQLASYEAEAKTLGANLPQPSSLGAPTRSLTDAEVAYSLGDYDTAANALFALSSRPGPDREPATYYLGETLYQKGDRGAARAYFTAIAQEPASKYYQPSLARLVEIAIAQQDLTAGDDAIAKLAGTGSPQLAYLRGKLAFARQRYDEALDAFGSVPKGSPYELQALYYAAATQVAKQDLAKATDAFVDLIARRPRSSADRRVIELGQLALGRLYYEREEPTKSIDAYLMIDRHSDLFPDALYEVAWVYVKDKQFDKALRALELLEQSDPDSTRTPTTRILEGNLRIRKAQSIRKSQIEGTQLTNDAQDPGVEYQQATALFTQTHDQYFPSYQAIAQVVDGNLDAAAFVDQLAGRPTHTVSAVPPMPEAAAQWLRDEPDVQRIVDVEQDLGEIADSIQRSEQAVDRLRAVIAAGDRTVAYPDIAARRHRIAALEASLATMRSELAEQQLQLVDNSGDVGRLAQARRELASKYAALGDAEGAYEQRIRDERSHYDAIDTSATEIASALGSTQAMTIAMRTYALSTKTPAPAAQLDAAAEEARLIEDELADIRRAETLGKDLAGISDAEIASARALRGQLLQAEDAEQRALAGVAAASREPQKTRALVEAADRASRVVASLDATDAQLDQIVAQGIEATKADLAGQEAILADSRRQLAEYEQEAHALSSAVLAQSFKDVKAKLYDVIVRTDVGVVDVSWSQKEDDDDDVKRLNLARSRELKQLHDEFKDILDETAPAPAPPKSDLPPPTPEGASPPPPLQQPAAVNVKPDQTAPAKGHP